MSDLAAESLIDLNATDSRSRMLSAAGLINYPVEKHDELVANQFPSKPLARRVAIVGEAPGTREVELGRPFVGPSGALLSQFLGSVGIDRDACFVGNVCQHKPPGNLISKFKWDGVELTAGRAQLEADLAAFQPDLCILLGNTPLRAFAGEHRTIGNWRGSVFVAAAIAPGCKCIATYHPAAVLREFALTGVCRFDYARAAKEARTGWTPPPTDRIDIDLSVEGLLLALSLVRERRLPVAPDIEGYPDAISCIGFATGPNDAFVVPFIRQDGTSYWDEETELRLWTAVAAVLEDPAVPKIMHNGLYELFCLGWMGICIRGFTDDTMVLAHELHAELEKSLAFIASIYTPHPYWKGERKTLDDRVALLYNGKDCCRTFECWQAMLPKLKPQQLAHYRTNMSCLVPLAYMTLRGMRFDKAEAKRRLKANQVAIYEKQDQVNQAVLHEGLGDPRIQRIRELYRAVGDDRPAEMGGTSGRGSKAAKAISPPLVALLATAFCKARCTEEREVEETKWQPMRWQGKRWIKAGKRTTTPDEAVKSGWVVVGRSEDAPVVEEEGTIWLKPITKVRLKAVPVAITTLKDVRRFARDSAKRSCRRACAIAKGLLAGNSSRSSALRGELSTLLNLHINVSSTGQSGDANWLLYEAWGLPKQFIKEGNKLTSKLASDDEAVIKAWVADGAKDDRAMLFLSLRRLLTESKYLKALPDADGRIRCALNLVGSPTGRMAAYGSMTGSSKINPQTWSKPHRSLFPADDGCVIVQSDLDGSDSWTVAAYCASLGDRTMLDDLLAKVKSAKVIALIYEHGPDVNRHSRDELRVMIRQVDGEGWLYFGCKRVLHGGNYGMKGQRMSDQILTDSFKLLGKPVYVSPKDCQRILDGAVYVRYAGVKVWHDWMKRQLTTTGSLTACNGFTRHFYGRKKDAATHREALSHMPQVMTTYAIKLALLSLWNDEANRRFDGSLRVEPLLCVHDSIVKQCQLADADFCKSRLPDWFNHELTVNGVKFVIPANSTGGPDWLHQGAEKYGGDGGFDL